MINDIPYDYSAKIDILRQILPPGARIIYSHKRNKITIISPEDSVNAIKILLELHPSLSDISVRGPMQKL